MNAEYGGFIYRLFPNVGTIIDRFHIILDNERTRTIRTIQDKLSRLYHIFKVSMAFISS